MSSRPCSLYCALLLLCACAYEHVTGGETWRLYRDPQSPADLLRAVVLPLLPEDTELCDCELRSQAAVNERDLRRQREALEDGVYFLPCLVLRDARGAYAVLSLNGTNANTLARARKLAGSPDRAEAATERSLYARTFYLMALACNSAVPTARRHSALQALRNLAARKDMPTERCQFIALRCLYPVLLRLYAEEYRDAHTPRSEALFNEAIRTLERTRDLDANSEYGRIAHEIREGMRTERLKHRKYE